MEGSVMRIFFNAFGYRVFGRLWQSGVIGEHKDAYTKYFRENIEVVRTL